MPACAAMPGALLGAEEIRSRLRAGDIFGYSTYSEERLRGAAYDVCLARDYLIMPDGRVFGPDRAAKMCSDQHLFLEAGEVAYVASKEKLQLAWDLCANIVPKYDLARRGLFVLFGGLVDPGYGLLGDGAGGWRPLSDERLHFVIANIGYERQALTLDSERIAALQFFAVREVPPERRVPIKSAVSHWRHAAAEPARLVGAMAFIDTTKKATDAIEARSKRLARQITVLQDETRHADAVNERVVVFGIYVMAAALLGAALAALVAILGGAGRAVYVHFGGLQQIGIGGVLLIGFAVALGIVLARVVSKLAGALCNRSPGVGSRAPDAS